MGPVGASYGVGRETISPLFLRGGTIPVWSYILQVWACDLELTSIFEEKKKKGKKKNLVQFYE